MAMDFQGLRVVVIGGGAAGFFSAIACAEANPHAQVTLLEASRTSLSKVSISGGGRCNVTHACFEPAALVANYPRGGKALRGAFTRFQPRDTIAWFTKRGVRLKTEADGRMFPTTDDSETIVQCLLQSARNAGVALRVGSPVSSVIRKPHGFQVTLKSGEGLVCDRLLLATGSSAVGFRLAVELGHTIAEPVPSLFTFTIPDPALRDLAGVAVDAAQVRLIAPNAKPLEQTGPLLITHWGLSGPAVLKLSAWGARSLHDCRYQATLHINWMPYQTTDAVRAALLSSKEIYPKRAIANSDPFGLPRRLWLYLIERANIPADLRLAELSKTHLHHLVQELTRGEYAIAGKGAFKEEFVTCGGVALKEVDFKTMESRQCPGLYLAGEILDIDGVTGGFNFQNAWTTGWLAGKAMAVPLATPNPL
ncbi:NAD(P)/FAD-dependent oxidoreductase [Leptolyngbya sp. AN02str]|uniref:NAD(P)/FAD-dependent oxidoreductase n=1 Tax=Leptolyngbya sp. AN02str TaxID=3423363 RepID=UPI003D317040